MELPLGIFTIAIITVYFPQLANAATQGDRSRFGASFNEGLRLILGITIPAGVGLIALSEPILDLLFNWGAFDQTDVAATQPLLIIYAVGLPLYSIATAFVTRGFHANKDMKSPVRVAAVCLISNAVLGLVLMQFFGAAGLAAANVISAGLQAILLLWKLSNSGIVVRGAIRPVAKMLAAACMMGGICWLGLHVFNFSDATTKWTLLLALVILIPVGVGAYLAVLLLLRSEEAKMLKGLLKRDGLR